MNSYLSLTKIGNLKLGIVNDGQPIQTENILVTLPTKEGTSNFKVFPGFNPKGEKEVEVSLVFNKPELNFEVNWIGFVQIDEAEYIVRATDLGEKLIMSPLYPDINTDMEEMEHGVLTQDKIEEFQMERTGFLKVMLTGVSSFGEVFYLKTKSANSIRAISDQLRILDVLTDGHSAGIPLVIKPIKKDVNDKQVVYVTIGFNGDISKSLSNVVSDLKNSPLNFKALENLYEESRESTPTVRFNDVKEDYEIKVLSNKDSGIAKSVTVSEDEASDPVVEYVVELVNSLENTKGIPLTQFKALFGSYKGNKKAFEEFLSKEENLKIGSFIAQISANNKGWEGF